MAKVNIKQALVEKGERYAFFAAAGVMVLLMLIGFMELSDSPDTEKFVQEVNQNTQGIKGKIGSQDARAEDLPDHARKVVSFPSVRMAELKALNFDPINPPDTRRTNPSVKPVLDIQADFVWAKIPALDIKDTEDGKRLIGVVVAKAAKTDVIDKEKQSKFFLDLQSRQRIPPGRKNPNPNPSGMGIMGGPVGMVGGPVGMVGGPVGMAGVMGGGPGPVGPPTGNLGMGGGRFGRGPDSGMGPDGPPVGFMGGMPAFGGQIEVGERLGIEYVPLESEKMEGKRLAITIYPQRMVIIHAAFPYREQVQEFARALRFKDPAELFDPKNDAAPIFKGFLIQRRILYADGRPAADWHNLNYESHYRDTIFPRTLGDHPDHPDLAYVKLPLESEMMMPLPTLQAMNGKYPDVRIPAIMNTIQKARDLNKPPALPKGQSKLEGKGNIFGNNNLEQGGFVAQPNSPEFKINPGVKRGMGMMGEGNMGTPPAAVQVAELPEAVLMRLVDNDIMPGRLYQYRMKVIMQNPNWAGRKDKDGKYPKKEMFELVSQQQDAKRELLGASELDSRVVEQRYFYDIVDDKIRAEEVRWNLDKAEAATPWFEMKGFVKVPQEEYFFAVDPPLGTPDPKEPKKVVGGVTLKPGEGLLQMQRWLPTANIKGYREPVADWVVADILAKRGYYLGGEQFVNLPIWSSEYNRYILRKVPADPNSKQKETRRGVVMDPTKPGPRYAVIDVEGGTINKRYGSKIIEDEAASEILLVDEDGNLQVRSTAYDRNRLDRYMEDSNGPLIVHSGNRVSRYQINTKYDPPAIRVVDREEVWNKWVDETDKASRVIEPDGGTGPVVPKKFD